MNDKVEKDLGVTKFEGSTEDIFRSHAWLEADIEGLIESTQTQESGIRTITNDLTRTMVAGIPFNLFFKQALVAGEDKKFSTNYMQGKLDSADILLFFNAYGTILYRQIEHLKQIVTDLENAGEDPYVIMQALKVEVDKAEALPIIKEQFQNLIDKDPRSIIIKYFVTKLDEIITTKRHDSRLSFTYPNDEGEICTFCLINTPDFKDWVIKIEQDVLTKTNRENNITIFLPSSNNVYKSNANEHNKDIKKESLNKSQLADEVDQVLKSKFASLLLADLIDSNGEISQEKLSKLTLALATNQDLEIEKLDEKTKENLENYFKSQEYLDIKQKWEKKEKSEEYVLVENKQKLLKLKEDLNLKVKEKLREFQKFKKNDIFIFIEDQEKILAEETKKIINTDEKNKIKYEHFASISFLTFGDSFKNINQFEEYIDWSVKEKLTKLSNSESSPQVLKEDVKKLENEIFVLIQQKSHYIEYKVLENFNRLEKNSLTSGRSLVKAEEEELEKYLDILKNKEEYIFAPVKKMIEELDSNTKHMESYFKSEDYKAFENTLRSQVIKEENEGLKNDLSIFLKNKEEYVDLKIKRVLGVFENQNAYNKLTKKGKEDLTSNLNTLIQRKEECLLEPIIEECRKYSTFLEKTEGVKSEKFKLVHNKILIGICENIKLKPKEKISILKEFLDGKIDKSNQKLNVNEFSIKDLKLLKEETLYITLTKILKSVYVIMFEDRAAFKKLWENPAEKFSENIQSQIQTNINKTHDIKNQIHNLTGSSNEKPADIEKSPTPLKGIGR